MVKLVCSRCQSVVLVPEVVMSRRTGQRLQCPVCHEPVEPEHRGEADTQGPVVANSPLAPSQAKSGTIRHSDEITPLHLAEAGNRIALVCISDKALSERMAQALNQLDYHVIVAAKPSSALDKLQYQQCDLVLLDEAFGEGASSENPVMVYIQRMAMPLRRRIFLCLLSRNLPTLDQMVAFRIGANLTINLRDADKIPLILDRILKDHQSFYGLFYDQLGKRG
ncbi:MAG TPA: hypothetical protein PKV86_04010, partial [Syntrophobacteraceae bacterium]|nr:hypothetical protein [Syntrophobacteraceae bacterium]